MTKTQKQLQNRANGWVNDPAVGLGISYKDFAPKAIPVGAIRFYEPGKMRWFELNGSTQQHLFTAHYTSLEDGGDLGVWLVDENGKFAYLSPWFEAANDSDFLSIDEVMAYYRIQHKTLKNPQRAAEFEEFIRYG
ncbi:MAG: hypothetical protein OSA89_18175 [Mariniblastus sp.]|nr:hypothetical protein [Mariniblastus sp.]